MIFIKKIICVLLVVLLSFSITSVSAEEVGAEVALVSEEVIMPRLRLGLRWRNCPYTLKVVNNWNDTYNSAIQNAMNTWNAIKGTNGNNLITFSFSTGSKIVEIREGNLDDDENGQCYFGTDSWRNYSYFEDLPEASIIVNNDNRFTNGVLIDKVDAQSLILHEMGHILGIAHCHENSASSCFSSTCVQNVMQPVLPRCWSRRILRSYDTASYISIYS